MKKDKSNVKEKENNKNGFSEMSKTENRENVIEIRNLCKEYKLYNGKKARLLEVILPKYTNHTTFTAMKDFDLNLKSGEILGILGKNGAGKSTLLKMITGVVVPTGGTIKINGKVSSLLELGTAFNPELTGYENIYQHGQVMGLTAEEVREKEKEIIDFADIGDHLYQPVKTYSSGMFARLAFACAINVDPDILIVDEVLSVGDMAFQLKCFKKFEDFKKKGKTILFVTHSIADVLKNCNRAIVLDKGAKIFDGGVKEGVDLYKKLITGMLDENYKDKVIEKTEKKITVLDEKAEWKPHFTLNPNVTVYGNNEATIYDYGMFDENGEPIITIDNDKLTVIKVKVRFNCKVVEPVFSITVKDFQGREICGTNTNFLNIETGTFNEGDRYIVEFKQKLPLAPSKYTLSVSCTRFDENGNHIILNRNYDALIFEVMSEKKLVGFFKIDPDVSFEQIDD